MFWRKIGAAGPTQGIGFCVGISVSASSIAAVLPSTVNSIDSTGPTCSTTTPPAGTVLTIDNVKLAPGCYNAGMATTVKADFEASLMNYLLVSPSATSVQALTISLTSLEFGWTGSDGGPYIFANLTTLQGALQHLCWLTLKRA